MERQTKGIWIPIEIWESKELTWNEKILFLEIDSFTSKEKDCYFSNEYIAKLLGVTENSANRILSSLINKGYVIKTSFDGRRRFIKTAFSYDKSDYSQKNKQDNQERINSLNEVEYIPNKCNNTSNDKEEKDKSFSKKDSTKEIIQFWNTQTSDFSKVRKQTADIEDKLAKLIKKGYSLEDVKKVILLCNSLPDFYKGREKGKTWKASLSWLLANTKDKFNMIYNGDLHTTFEQQKIYESIMNGNTDDMKMEYRPQLDGFNLHWNEQAKCYISMYDIDMLFDGYNADNRPSSAMVMKNGVRYKWNTQTKKWEVQ